MDALYEPRNITAERVEHLKFVKISSRFMANAFTAGTLWYLQLKRVRDSNNKYVFITLSRLFYVYLFSS